FRRFILLALPLMLGQTITSLDEQFLRVFGSLTGEGAVALLMYAKRIAMVPVGLVGTVAAVASYPFLVTLLTKGDKEGFARVLARAMRTGIGIIVPFALWMAFLSPSVFTLLFYGGRMAEAEMVRAIPLLQLLLCSAPFWLLLELMNRGFYAQSDTITPAVTGTLVTIVFLPIYYFIAVPNGPDAVALCSTAGLATYAVLTAALWIRREGTAAFSGLPSTAVKSALCALPGTVAGVWLDRWVNAALSDCSPIVAALAGLMVAGLLFVGTFVPLGLRFCPEIFERIREKLEKRGWTLRRFVR
ncbi:MAG: lipid II flippase MurJ, partial [Desulfovibrionaceae bacterium]|nr:lipid II flippase MurJ [Desulfovibrionaceae bacterium]